jgi:hypothetical protein
MKKILIFITLLVLMRNGNCQLREYKITSFGAKPDGKTNNAAFIQKAIDEVSANGGGKIIIPAGNFLSGEIYLKSGVELNLEAGAILLGSIKLTDYNTTAPFSMKNFKQPLPLALIGARDQKNISITGPGIIDGQAGELIKNVFLMMQNGSLQDPLLLIKSPTTPIQQTLAHASRAKLIEFINCDKIRISGVTLKTSSFWVQNYLKCSNLIIDEIKVESTAYWNNDGIDVTDCKNVTITNCFINASEDGICLKSIDPQNYCENINIANCTIRSSGCAFKLGTWSYGGFKKVTVRDLTVYDTYRAAIAIECVDGGILEDIDVQNVTAKSTGNAIFIRLGHRIANRQVGQLHGIYIANVKVGVPMRKPDLGYPVEGPPINIPHNVIPSSITGIPGYRVKDVLLENIEIVYSGGASKEIAYIGLDSLKDVPEDESGYPEFSEFGELPAWGFYVRHAEGIEMKNIKLSYLKYDFRPACIFDDVNGLRLDNIQIPTGKELPIILLNDVNKLSLEKIQLPVENERAIKIQKTKSILLKINSLNGS